jgi:hypothetical protein
MAKGLRYFISLEKQKRLLKTAGASEKDYFISSFPKSGNTWLRYLLAFANFPDEKISKLTLKDFLPAVYNKPFKLNHLAPPRFIKTHDVFFSLYPKTIYICRDYRDVIVSYFYYLQKMHDLPGTISQFIRSNKMNSFGPWSWHITTALEWKEKHPDKILFLKYESLLADPEKELQQVLDFCKISPRQSISEIVQAASFGNLRKMEENNSQAGKAFFFRKGIAGDWKNALTEEDINYLLSDKKTNEVMKRLGYL